MIEYNLLLSPEADLQIRETSFWYDDRQNGLGFDFLSMVEEALKEIKEAPLMYAIYHRHFKKGTLSVFHIS